MRGTFGMEYAVRFLVAAAMILVASTTVKAADESRWTRPINVELGAPGTCDAVKQAHATEVIVKKGSSLTLKLLKPEVAFPGATQIIVSCTDDAFVALVMIAEFDAGRGEGTAAVLSELNDSFGKRHECPQVSEEPMTCAIFEKGPVFAIFTGADSEDDSDEYSIVYGHTAEPGKVADKIRALQGVN